MASRKKRNLIGFVTSSIVEQGSNKFESTASFDFFAALTSEVLQKLQGDYDVVVRIPALTRRGNALQQQQRLLDGLVNDKRFSGFVIAPVDSNIAMPPGLRAVAVDQPVSRLNQSVPSVVPDNENGGELAASALFKYWESIPHNERPARAKFLVVEGTGTSPERAESFQKKINTLISSQTEVERSGPMPYEYDKGYEWIKRRTDWRDWEHVIGIFACNDELAMGVRDALDALAKEDIRDQLRIKAAVVGFDGLRDVVKLIESSDERWLINTVLIPVAGMATKVREVLDKLHQNMKCNSSKVPCELVVSPREQQNYRTLQSRRRGWRKAFGRKLRPDIAVLTIKQEEYNAVAKLLGKKTYLFNGINRDYLVGLVKHRNGRNLQVAVLRQDGQGYIAAQDAARDAIDDLDPWFMALVGIGGAEPAEEYCLGDVVIGNKLYDMTVGARKDGGIVERSVTGTGLGPESGRFVANINVIKGLERWVHKLSLRQPDVSLDDDQFYGDNNIMERARGILHRRFNGDEVRRTPIYRIGAIGGDGFLIRDASVPIAWRSFARDLILFEMELPGVFAACNRPFRQYPLIVVRSISDIVGFQRSIEWTDYACSTAAVFFIEMIKSHPSMEKRS